MPELAPMIRILVASVISQFGATQMRSMYKENPQCSPMLNVKCSVEGGGAIDSSFSHFRPVNESNRTGIPPCINLNAAH